MFSFLINVFVLFVSLGTTPNVPKCKAFTCQDMVYSLSFWCHSNTLVPYRLLESFIKKKIIKKKKKRKKEREREETRN